MISDIRAANVNDLGKIKAWLFDEYNTINEGFYSNCELLEDSLEEGFLFTLDNGNYPVAFLADSSNGPNILEVHPRERRKGYGRIFSDWIIRRAFDRGLSVLEIACAPITSVPFWSRMGFTPHPSRSGRGGGVYAHLVLERSLEPILGRDVLVEIDLFPESRAWNTGAAHILRETVTGTICNDGSIILPKRIIFFDPNIEHCCDCILCVAVNGQSIFEDKIKRSEAKSHGIEIGVDNVYFADRIIL